MTYEEACEVLELPTGHKPMSWLGYGQVSPTANTLCLDGHFTLEELEAIVIYSRHQENNNE